MRLNEYIEKANLVFPDYSNINIVDLAKYLYKKYGSYCNQDSKQAELKKIIPNKKHTILVLIDGMGSNLINIMPNNSLLKTNKKIDMLTVSPSSTGCVLTSLATATYPTEHGIIGWYNYNRKHNIDYLPLCFKNRKNNKDLEQYNIKVDDIFKINSKLNELNVKTTVFYPKNIYDSVYSNYVVNKKNRKSYSSYQDAINQILEIISLDEETFTYLYIPNIDTLEHDNGYDSKEVLNELKEIENQLERLKNEDTVTIVTADHGQTNVNKYIVMDFKKYDAYFYAYPGIDFGMATYYVKNEKKKEFEKEFAKDFKNKMYLFETKEFINDKIFGPNENNKILLENLGEYISICNSDSLFINSLQAEKYFEKAKKGNHSGLTSDEMIIPLIIF